MLKDRDQKARALAYVVSKRWFPQLELDVSTHVTIQPKPINITDVDVFATIPAELGKYRHVLIDCKTGRNESPIGRALWLRGLMERIRAERGICILRTKSIQTDHRYSAAQLGITLLAEEEFVAFGSATSHHFNRPTGAIGSIAVWDRYFSIVDRSPKIAPAIEFSRSAFWMSESDVEACTRTLYTARNLSRELDPAKPEHLAVVGDLSALFLHALARIVNTIFAGYLQPESRDQLSSALLMLLYGGRSSYTVRNRIKKMAVGNSDFLPDLSLPEWNRFVQLVRQALDAPYELLRSPLIVREVAWSLLSEDKSSSFVRTLTMESPQGARLAVLGIEYLCRASKLPPEFMSQLTHALLEAQIPESKSTDFQTSRTTAEEIVTSSSPEFFPWEETRRSQSTSPEEAQLGSSELQNPTTQRDLPSEQGEPTLPLPLSELPSREPDSRGENDIPDWASPKTKLE